MITAEGKSEFKLTIDTPYLTIMVEVWGVYHEDFEEKNNGTALGKTASLYSQVLL